MEGPVTAILSPIGLLLLGGAASAAAARRWVQLLGLLRSSQRREKRLDHIPQRLGAFVVYVLAQARLLRWPFAGILHALIFWGFVILLTAIAQGIVEALWQGFQFQLLPGSGASAFPEALLSLP